MGSGLRRSTRALAATIASAALLVTAAPPAGATSRSADTAVAEAGAFVASDFPQGFAGEPASTKTHKDNIRLAKGVDGCGPYVALQKALKRLPQVKSERFGDGSRSIGNEVDVFPSEKAASAALELYAKPSVVGCLENLFEKQARQDPEASDTLADSVVSLDRQDIAGLGDDSVVYEGSVAYTGPDGTKNEIRIGSAAVRVGRAVDVVTYSTAGASLTDVLTPAIDASVSRVRTELARSGT